MKRKTRQPDRGGPLGGKGGFTLIELLVVMGILAVLIGLVVGIGAWIARDAKIKQTIIAQKVILEAINAFYTTSGNYPADAGGGAASETTLLTQLVPTPPAVPNAAVAKILQGLSVIIWRPGDLAFKDGFRKNMRYQIAGGMGGTPVVISAGPDGSFTTTADDIRSDMQ